MDHWKWLPVVDPDLCNGCGMCIEACGPQSLELVRNVAQLVTPDTCGSEEHCIPVCKYDAIRMEWVAFDGNAARGVWTDDAKAPPVTGTP